MDHNGLTEAPHLAFNAGSQARLDGYPQRCCPYPWGSLQEMDWKRGWRDVDIHWGELARWPVTPLPPLKNSCD